MDTWKSKGLSFTHEQGKSSVGHQEKPQGPHGRTRIWWDIRKCEQLSGAHKTHGRMRGSVRNVKGEELSGTRERGEGLSG